MVAADVDGARVLAADGGDGWGRSPSCGGGGCGQSPSAAPSPSSSFAGAAPPRVSALGDRLSSATAHAPLTPPHCRRLPSAVAVDRRGRRLPDLRLYGERDRTPGEGGGVGVSAGGGPRRGGRGGGEVGEDAAETRFSARRRLGAEGKGRRMKEKEEGEREGKNRSRG